MPKQYSIAEARNCFAALVHDVEREAAIELTRHGKPVAMLLSIQEYNRLTSDRPGFWQALQSFRTQVDLAALEIAPEMFAGRDRSSGREVEW